MGTFSFKVAAGSVLGNWKLEERRSTPVLTCSAEPIPHSRGTFGRRGKWYDPEVVMGGDRCGVIQLRRLALV